MNPYIENCGPSEPKKLKIKVPRCVFGDKR